MTNCVSCCCHVLRRERFHVFRRVFDFEVEGQWEKQVEKEFLIFGLSKEDTLCRSKWIAGINLIASGLR